MILWHVGLTMLVVWFVMRGNPRVDYRLVVFGALVPDLIDKPIGRLLFRERFESGRIFAHTLLLNVAFFSVLFFLRGRRKRALTLVPVASLLHIAEDGVWSDPRVFWWPLFGTSFPRDPVPGGLLAFVLDPVRSPGVLLQELVGLGVLVWLFAAHGMLSVEGIRAFVRTGHLEMPRQEPTG